MSEYLFSIEGKPDVCEAYNHHRCKRIVDIIIRIQRQTFFNIVDVQLTLMSAIVCKKHYNETKQKIDFKEPDSTLLEDIYKNPLIRNSEINDFKERIMGINTNTGWDKDKHYESRLIYAIMFEITDIESTANRLSHHYYTGFINTKDIAKAILVYAPTDYRKYLIITKPKIKSLTEEQGYNIDVEELL